MHIDIKATNMDLTDAIREYVQSKMDALDKFVDGADTSVHAAVDVGLTTKHHHNGEVFYAEVNLHTALSDFYATAEEEDLYAAIDKVQDIVSRELRSSKKKHTDLTRRGARAIKRLFRRGEIE